MLKNFFLQFPSYLKFLWNWFLEKFSQGIQLTSPEFGAAYLLSFLMMILFAYLFNGAHALGESNSEALWAVAASLATIVFVIMTVVLIYLALVEWFKKISRNY